MHYQALLGALLLVGCTASPQYPRNSFPWSNKAAINRAGTSLQLSSGLNAAPGFEAGSLSNPEVDSRVKGAPKNPKEAVQPCKYTVISSLEAIEQLEAHLWQSPEKDQTMRKGLR